VREAVPLGGVLQGEQRHVVRYHVGELGIVLGERKAEVLLACTLSIANRSRKARRLAARIEHAAARIVERQRERERDAFLHLGDALQHLLARHEIHAPALVVRAELAPVGARRPVLPAHQ
jgi:hypothetical protein